MTRFLAIVVVVFCASLTHCTKNRGTSIDVEPSSAQLVSDGTSTSVVVGASQLDVLLPKLKDKRVALVVNYTATVGDTHLADTLKGSGVVIKKIMAPEHGFRGTAANGEHVKDGFDTKTNLPVVSLYGNNRKPTADQLSDVDVVVYDIQDVGVRFFTYIGTLHYVMEACAENGKKLIVLDRPNPNSGYIDGPVLSPDHKSFVGMHPVPVVHNMTVAEFAQMINGEGWLGNNLKCDLEVIALQNWKHGDRYSLPLKPSPNLPNDQAVRLYPSICFFEGTVLSLGRGTDFPFQALGHPDLKGFSFQFTPVTIEGIAKNPPQENKLCYGLDLRNVKIPEDKIDLHYLIDMYKAFPEKDKFFNSFFERLAGNDILRQQIKDGLSEEEIRKSWQKDLEAYKEIRKKYVLY
jgi:uncharacterized protein YbbC (DUF1343 family)